MTWEESRGRSEREKRVNEKNQKPREFYCRCNLTKRVRDSTFEPIPA